ncbi:hypothetical protein ACC696_16570 [Rhizobium ruizarguesonis]
MVAVAWSHFEMLLHITATSVFHEEPETLGKFENMRSMQTRLNMVQAGVTDKMLPHHRGVFLELIREARDCQQMRDRIIHGAWSGSGDDPIENPASDVVSSFLKPRHPFEWKLDFGKIKAVALRIDKLAGQWMDAVLTGSPKDVDALLSESIKRKLKT